MRHLVTRTLTAALLLAGVVACSTDTPTAPERTPAPPPGSGSPSAVWNITVTAEPGSLVKGSDQPAIITIRVRRADNGQPAPGGTTVVVSTNLGEFGELDSGVRSATVVLNSSGLAQLLYFAGEILGTDVIQALLESSAGQALVEIVEDSVFFITGVSPNSGPGRGGTRIRIEGTGFIEPLRVDIGGLQAAVDRVGSDGSFIRAITGEVVSSSAFFSTQTCDSNGDGTLNGTRFIPTTKDLKVTLASGGDATLTAAFTYEPDDTRCRSTTPSPNSPQANFSFVANGLTVLFSNTSTPSSGLTFTWVFGDGSATSSVKDPTHTYVCPTATQPVPPCSFDVTLRAVNASGSSNRTQTVTVSP